MVECSVLELRQYTVHAERRDDLVALFDRHFVDSQEACGARIFGQFRDVERPDRFVWLRGFASMDTRPSALDAFYGSPVWKEHSAAANACMVDVDDVLLLRPILPLAGLESRPDGVQDEATAVICAEILTLRDPLPVPDARAVLEQRATEEALLGAFVEEPAPNNWPALPVRSGEHLLVTITRGTPTDLGPALHDLFGVQSQARQALRLAPTPGSRLR